VAAPAEPLYPLNGPVRQTRGTGRAAGAPSHDRIGDQEPDPELPEPELPDPVVPPWSSDAEADADGRLTPDSVRQSSDADGELDAEAPVADVPEPSVLLPPP
jgi:hypothetical protein